MLLCSHYTLTWYPGVYPSATGGMVLQSASRYIEEGSALDVQIGQLVERADYVRGEVPDFFPRGSKSMGLQWEEARLVASPGAALAAALDAAASLPSTAGWLRIDIASEGRAWAVTPATIRATGGRHRKSGGQMLLLIRWQVDCGPATEIAVTAEDAAMTLETGAELLTEPGDYLALETYVAP